MVSCNLTELKIEVTYNCPLSCVHCSSEANEDNTLSISQEKCINLIYQASNMGVKSISFSGGEPLVWDGLEEVVEYCNSLKIDSIIYTSGNGADVEKKFENLSKVGLKKAIFSVYSPLEKEHIRITRKLDSFQNTIKSISLCKKLGIIPEIHFVALASNYGNLEKIVELSKELGVETVSVLRFVPQGRGMLIEDRDTLTHDQNLELIRTINKIRKSGFNIRTGSPFNVLLLNDNPKCMAAQDRMIVAPDLSIYPCDAFKQIKAEQIIDPVEFCSLTNNTLEDCWNNSSYLNLIRKVSTSTVEEPCGSCLTYPKCLSGCMAQKFLKYGSFNHPDPSCLIRGAQK